MKPLRTLMIAAVASTVLALPAYAEVNGTTGMTPSSANTYSNPSGTTYGTNYDNTRMTRYGDGVYGNNGLERTNGYTGNTRVGTYGTRTNAVRTYDADNDNDGANWLGLLGLLGLAGLFGRNRHKEDVR